MARIGQQKRCCVPSGQSQVTHFCSDSAEPLGAWMKVLVRQRILIETYNQGRLKAGVNCARAQGLGNNGSIVSFSTQLY
ncbi:hypothetical protein TNCV_2692461 [Trichonephila clavipes]|uniref:Uncharacterized protein n=1 Tax=Trichonephila clavipes TaxID=2585209 RepID=A0A8X6VYW1_TRICX|nr:hypothetical protein TNCV_2692461 [Trichonephila clavipes]